MSRKSTVAGAFAIILFLVATSSAARAEAVGAIRVTDRGPFQVWNGVDADVPGSGARVLAVIGPAKSIRVNYTSSMPAPQVLMGSNWVEIAAGAGTAFTFGGRDQDCYDRFILMCINKPIEGVPPGAILCYCKGQDDAICCTSDTGIYTDGIVLKRAQL